MHWRQQLLCLPIVCLFLGTAQADTPPRRPSFRNDVMPVFFRAGCNAGTCHGSARGKDGFQLSLFGYDPAGDYRRVVDEMVGRLVNLALPEQSLLLLKATGKVPHTGGKLFTAESHLYQTLLDWIAAGAPDDEDEVAEVTGISLSEKNLVFETSGKVQPLRVTARYSDGSSRDVTELARFFSNNASTADIDADGVITARGPGDTNVFARFSRFTEGAEAIVLPPAEGFVWPNPPANTFIDKLVFDRLEKLRIVPSGLCDDETFLRRVTLDLIARPPTPAEYQAFMADPAADKRDRKIDALLSDEAFAKRIADVEASLAGGADFAAVAAESSDDIGSSGFGGDLGFTAGDAFPEEMEAVIAELPVDSVSAPVETEAGVHIIKVTERGEGEPPSLEEMRADLEEQLALAEARVELLRTVEILKDLAFNAQNLDAPAAELELEVLQSEKVSRDHSEGLFASASLISAAFSDDVLNAGHNSDVVELNRDHWVVVSVREHHPAAVMPLAEVQAEIVASITDQRARAAVEAAAVSAVASLRAGESVEAYATDSGLEWQVELGADRRNNMVPAEVLASAFRLAPPAEGASVVDYVLSNSGDALVYEIDRVTPGAVDSLQEGERQGLQQMVGAEYSQLIDNEYQQSLQETAEISVL